MELFSKGTSEEIKTPETSSYLLSSLTVVFENPEHIREIEREGKEDKERKWRAE